MFAWWGPSWSVLSDIKAELNSLTLVPVMDLCLLAQSSGAKHTPPVAI